MRLGDAGSKTSHKLRLLQVFRMSEAVLGIVFCDYELQLTRAL